MKSAQNTSSVGLAAKLALLNSGTAVIYSGTQPANPDTALSGNTALCTGTFSASAFGSVTLSGSFMQATASFTAASYAPSANGTATFARLFKSDGTTVWGDLTVGTSGTDFIIGSTTINTGVQTSFALTIKEPTD